MKTGIEERKIRETFSSLDSNLIIRHEDNDGMRVPNPGSKARRSNNVIS